MKTSEVAEHFGGKSRLAEALQISPAAVSMWGEKIPEGRQYQIQILTKGKFKAEKTARA